MGAIERPCLNNVSTLSLQLHFLSPICTGGDCSKLLAKPNIDPGPQSPVDVISYLGQKPT